jgi:hypothetical protein
LYVFHTSIFPRLNIGADKEAAEHFLSALSLQDTTNGDSSSQLWFTLRRALLSMVRKKILTDRTIFTEIFSQRIALTSPNWPTLKPRAV